MCIDAFQEKANDDEKQQYERFVAIKEACGNLFALTLFSLPIWLFRWVRERWNWNWLDAGLRRVLAVLYFAAVLIGLHRMNEQHVHRQKSYATNLAIKHVGSPAKQPVKLQLDLEGK